MLLKSKLKITEILISKALIDLNITHYKFVLTNNVLKEFYDMKKESKNSNNKEKFKKAMLSYCSKYRKKIQKLNS